MIAALDPDRRHELVRALGVIARLGRHCRIVLELASQRVQAGDEGIPTEIKDNCAFRVGLGALSQQGALATFGAADVGRNVELGTDGRPVRGRGLAGSGGRWARVQSLYLPNPARPGGEDAERHFPPLSVDGPGGVQHVARRDTPVPGAPPEADLPPDPAPLPEPAGNGLHRPPAL